MLGAEQEAWLDRAVRRLAGAPGTSSRSRRSWRSSTCSPGDGQRVWTDGWDGYPAARRRLLESIVARRLANPVVIGGDVHMHFVTDLKLDFDDPDSPVVASEFVGTSITSPPGTWQRAPAGDPAPRTPTSSTPAATAAATCAPSVTGGRLTAELVGLDTVRKPDSRAEVLARFVVEDGRAGPQPA